MSSSLLSITIFSTVLSSNSPSLIDVRPLPILTSFTPPQKGAGQMLEGNDMATCEKLAGILLEKHII